MLKWAYWWIMHYNISLGVKKNFYFYLKKNIECGDGDGAIPEPVGDGDEVHFLIPVGYG